MRETAAGPFVGGTARFNVLMDVAERAVGLISLSSRRSYARLWLRAVLSYAHHKETINRAGCGG